MGRTTTTTNREPAGRRRRPRPAARLVQAAIVMGVLLAAGARVMAAPVGPIAAAPGASGTATVDYGIDGRGLVDRVIVHRAGTSADPAPATVELADAQGRTLASVTAVLEGPDTVVALPVAVDPALVGRLSVRA